MNDAGGIVSVPEIQIDSAPDIGYDAVESTAMPYEANINTEYPLVHEEESRIGGFEEKFEEAIPESLGESIEGDSADELVASGDELTAIKEEMAVQEHHDLEHVRSELTSVIDENKNDPVMEKLTEEQIAGFMAVLAYIMAEVRKRKKNPVDIVIKMIKWLIREFIMAGEDRTQQPTEREGHPQAEPGSALAFDEVFRQRQHALPVH